MNVSRSTHFRDFQRSSPLSTRLYLPNVMSFTDSSFLLPVAVRISSPVNVRPDAASQAPFALATAEKRPMPEASSDRAKSRSLGEAVQGL